MNKNKHLTLEDRIIIEQKLKERETFKGIARELDKDPTGRGHLFSQEY